MVKAKIYNQSQCLRFAGAEVAAAHVSALANRVRSGDSENVEAAAAQYYFPALYGTGFIRGGDNGINAGLNYGYAILRGCVARALTVYGFLPALGIHHRSELNHFNLADDLMEPFRPVIDLLVFQTMGQDDELTPPKKRALFNCLNLDILSGGQHHSVSYAVERVVRSLANGLSDKTATLLLPELLPTTQHRYE